MSANSGLTPDSDLSPDSELDLLGLDDLGLLTAEFRTVLGRLMRRLRVEYRFPLTQASVLGRLDTFGPSCIGALANAERVRPQSMSQTLGELETEGYIERRPDQTDGRRTQIVITPAGSRALAADRAVREGWLAREIEQFTPQERETLRRAVALMQRLANKG